MGEGPGFKEKRRHPRVKVNRYVDFQVAGEPCPTFGMIMNISQAGLLIQGFKDVPVGARIIIEVVPPEGFESPQGRAVTEIVWKDICLWDDWEGFQYGLKFIPPSKTNHLEPKQVEFTPTGLIIASRAAGSSHPETGREAKKRKTR